MAITLKVLKDTYILIRIDRSVCQVFKPCVRNGEICFSNVTRNRKQKEQKTNLFGVSKPTDDIEIDQDTSALTSNLKCMQKQTFEAKQKAIKQSAKSPTKTWQKCCTPRRTYLKPGRHRYRAADSPGISSRHRNFVYCNNYASQSIARDHCRVAHSRTRNVSLLIDRKVKISPERYKKQFNNWSDITKSTGDACMPKTKYALLNNLWKNYDLFTQTSRIRCYSASLQRIFKSRCVQKVDLQEMCFHRSELLSSITV